MKSRAGYFWMLLLLAILLPAPTWAARQVHYFGCNDCHRAGMPLTNLNNLCLKCHDAETGTGTALNDGTPSALPTRKFISEDASNALGSLAAIPGYTYDPGTAKEISHLWGVGDTKPEAGATPPVNPIFAGKNNASRGKIFCARCHNAHNQDTYDRKLLKLDNSADQMCMDCHAQWYIDEVSARLTHPVGPTTTYSEVLAGDINGRFKATITNVNSGDVRLVQGYVSCTSCHGMHFTDSDSSTADSYTLQATMDGDGHQLRSDGPTRANKSALCQACHAYQEHGKMLDGGESVGCLGCHSGHAYNGGVPNFFVLRGSVTTSTYGNKSITYTSATQAWNDNTLVTATGYCEVCHGSAETIPKGAGMHTTAMICRDCHKHKLATGGTYSFQNDANAATCGDCHGFPPYVNDRGDRNTGGVDGGYAYQDAAHNYALLTDDMDESATPHNAHAAGSLPQGAATDYNFGSGVEACNPCHNGLSELATHDTTTDPGSYRDFAWSNLSTAGLLSPAYKQTTPNQWTCSAVYCHSNGGTRNAGGTKVLGDYTTVITPAWLNGKNTLIGTVNECNACHGNSSSTMTTRNNSTSHGKHLGGGSMLKTYSCNACHSLTATSSTALASGARLVFSGGKHVNGAVEVSFNGSYSLGGAAMGSGSYTGGAAGTCTVYCHTNGKGVPASITPDWDNAASGACGTCHGVTAATLTTGSHTIHINSSEADVSCNACHGSGAISGTHSGHVDGLITKLTTAASCDVCHGIDVGDTSPTWGLDTSISCQSCHSGATTTNYTKRGGAAVTAPAKPYAATVGHNRPSASGAYPVTGKPAANKQCTACHLSSISTGHVDGLGNGDLLVASFSCESCHTAAGSRYTEATVRVKTHANTDPAYTMQKRVDFTKACLACHDPHGTYNGVSNNGAMLESVRTTQNAKDASGNYGGNVTFTALTLTDSFDEADASNLDDVCATCHTTTVHNNRTATGSHNSYEGSNCTTVCHGHNGINGGFMPSGGTYCNDCHGNPPNPLDDRPAGKAGAHAAHVNVVNNEATDDKFDCEVCHPGAASFTAAHANGSVSLAAGVTNGTCSAACHYSANDGAGGVVDDGYWTDTDGLNCNSCHYWNNNPTGSGNVAVGNSEAVSPTHNKHFDSGRLCTTCHTNNASDIMAPHTHITDNELWTLNNTNDGSVLTDRGNATPDEATVTVSSWNDGTDNCSNAACHNPSGLTKSATWGTPNAQGCDFCHSSTNPDAGKGTPGSHGDHMGATTNFGITVACTSCHPNNTSNAHLNSAVNLNGGFAYTTSLTDYTSSTYGRCTTTTCHNNGRGTAVQTPVWGVDSADCSICHAAPPVMTNNRHAEHVANTGYVANPNACGKCHLLASATQITATTHIDGTRNVGSQITDMDLVTGGNQLVAPGGWNGTCANNCHLVDTTGTWTDAAANKLTCLECHTSGKLAGGAYPNTGLHIGPLTVSANTHNNSFKVTRNEGTPTGTCLTCHPGIDLANDLPATHYAGGAPVPADATIPATVGYTAGSPSTCGPNGALVNCHDDKGIWKRRWSDTARTDATPNNECGNCHGNFDLTWVTGISQRHSSDAQIHGGHNGAGVNDCYICHTFGWAATYPDASSANHRDGSIQLNNGMLFNDDGATVHCTGCHDNKPLGLADGQYSFQDTNNADGADGGLNRWGRVEQAGPPANCNGCHALTNGLDHDGINESLAVHDYHTGSPLAPGCGACHPADSGPGGTLHQNNSLDFGGSYLSLTAYAVTPGVGGDFANTNCSTANGCHDSQLNSWKNDTLANCGDCHAATTKLMYTGSGLSGFPPTSNEHDIHIANNAYVGATPTTDCDDCHGTGASAPGHLTTHNDGSLTVIATGSKITQLNPDKSCTNTCHATGSGREWDSATTLVCTDCHSGSYLGKANKNHTSGLHAATVATAHDDSFGVGGSCTSCHTAINLTTPTSHVDGVKTDPNTSFGLFANYRTANGDCYASCHADGGDWRRKWTGAVDAKPLETDAATAAVCGNCHGSFATGWRFVNEANTSSTDHTDPDADNSGDQMNTAGHQVCSACHGWGAAAYDSANKHQNSSLTMNADLGYTDGTGTCTTNCHHGLTLSLKTDSGFTTETGAFGGLGCGACHDDGALPPNSGAHAAHGADADADYTECEACHGTDNGGSWASLGGAHNKGTVNFAAGIIYSNGGTAGTNAAAADDTCNTTVCHSPAGNAATWGTPASIGCNECHYYEAAPTGANNTANANPLSPSHNKHFNKAKVCTDCHSTLPTSRTHIAAKTGTDGQVLTLKANAAQNDADPISRSGLVWDDNNNTCSGIGLGCHASGTPDWDIPITSCVICHSNETNSTFNPTSGLHNFSAATRHDDTLQAGACINCHDATSPSSLHQDGTKQSSATATFTFNATKVLGYSSSAGCAANCHRDQGQWRRKWSSATDLAATGGSGQAVCNNCHGQFGSWNSGTVHFRSGTAGATETKGQGHTDADPAKCEDCHGYPSAASHNSNSKVDFSGNGTAYTLAWGTDADNPGWFCLQTGCHTAGAAGLEDAATSGTHTYLDSLAFPSSNKVTPQGIAYVNGVSTPSAACNGCHINVSGEFWPDGTVSPDNGGAHEVHVTEIAKKKYSTSSPDITQKNSTCDYCHPGNTHGGADGTLPADVSHTDLDGNGFSDGTDPEQGSYMNKIIGGLDDTNPRSVWNRPLGTCSQVACHAAAPYTPHWYTDTVAPANVTLTAALGPVPRSIKLTWVAPGDDGVLDGTAYKYDIRMSKVSSTDATTFSSDPQATNLVKGVPTVKRKGEAQETIIHGVDPSTTYYFALRTYDRAGNYGGTANSGGYVSYTTPAATTLDNVAPVLTGSPSWYGIDSAKALDNGTVKLSWTRAEDHSMPITYDIWWSTGTITYGTPQASTKDTSYRVTGLTVGQSYNFAVRAKDAYNNTDTNLNVLQAIPQGLNAVPKTNVIYYANGTATSNIPMQTAVHTVDGTTTTLPAVFIGPTAFSATTDLFVNGFSVNVVNTNVVSTLRAELGYITGTSTWNSFTPTAIFATDVDVAKRATRLVTFKFSGVQKQYTALMNAKVGVRVSVSAGAVTSVGWGPTSKGGIFTFAQQPINAPPSTPAVSTSVSGSNITISMAVDSTDTADGVADTVHYDVYGSANGGTDGFPYVIATGLTTRPNLVWDTQAAGIALDTAVSNVQVKVEFGDTISGKTLSHSASTPANIAIDNRGDNVAPGAITNFKAETRPKQGSVYLSWTAPGDDGTNNGRALSYDIRYATAVIDNDTKYNAATPLPSEPYPDFGGNGQGYEVLDLLEGNYFFAIKAVDEGLKTSPLAYTLATEPTAAGPKCGICHSTPPDETATKGNHSKHGYTMNDCGNCHGTEAKTFTTDHQDGTIKLGWKTAAPASATVVDQTVTYYQDPDGGGPLSPVKIYEDTTGSGGFNQTSPVAEDDGKCFSWSNQNVSGCHGPAAEASWSATATLVCSSCHGVASRPLDAWGHSFDDPGDDVKAAPPVDNHGYDGTGATVAERKYVGAHVPHLNYSFRLSKGDSCRMCHGSSRPGSSLHADGIIDVELDKAAAGDTALWNEGTPTTAGTCTSLSLDSCHPAATGPIPVPTWDSAQTFACTMCHGFGGATPPHTTDPGKNINLIDNDLDTGDAMPGNCTWCHVGGHPKEKKVLSITKASPAVVTTANPHNLSGGEKVTIHTQTGMVEINNKTFTATYINATQFSLLGSNTTTYGTFDNGTWIEGNGTGIILIPNDSRSGINYTSGGVHLKATIGGRAEQSSEAELCWSCHDQNGDGDLNDATDVSEWGADGNPFARTDNTTATTAPENGNDYNFGTLSTRSWIGATWTSGTIGTYGFGYKTGTIRSTHSTDPTGTTALTGVPYGYTNGGVDVVSKIHCSNCHDVHDSTNSPMEADGLNPDGAPYLRGTWKSNPYKEDGAPQAGQTYAVQSTAATPGYGYGQVPRANPSTSNAMGGYWIDQNSGNPTATWSYDSSAGLCQLCHSKNVDTLNVTDDNSAGGGLWINAAKNGHANSALGGSGAGANIFLQGAVGEGRNGADGATGGSGTKPNVNAWMGFENTVHSGTVDYGYGPRSGDGAYLSPLQTPSKVKMSVLVFGWGNAVDATTLEVGYHAFSCSKCHNPHASRLPKLMITNCLDVSHNTWDLNYDNLTGTGTVTTINDTTTGKWGTFGTATSSWSQYRLSHLSTAQNCHRYIDVNGDNTPDEKGWNKVTPW